MQNKSNSEGALCPLQECAYESPTLKEDEGDSAQKKRILFLTWHGFDSASGISKKMLAQVKGLKQNGHIVSLCHYGFTSDGHRCRFVDDQIIKNYGRGEMAAIWQRMSYGCIVKYCVTHHIEVVYVRSYMNASPFLIRLFGKLRKAGVRSVMEVPTYPYDQEFNGYDWKQKLHLWIDKQFRRRLARQMEAIVTFSDAENIFGQHTIRISNGIDPDMLPLHVQPNHNDNEIHLIAVAEVHSWHGFDRLIHGLGLYHRKHVMKSYRKVVFHIVGKVWDAEMEGSRVAPGYAPYIREFGIQDLVVFHGQLYGHELDEVFSLCSVAIGSLARHRCGISIIRTLKNREYACRGLPFIYSECDPDFDNQPYIMKVPADESPIDIEDVLAFGDSVKMAPSDIRATVSHLSWKNMMQKVMNEL